MFSKFIPKLAGAALLFSYGCLRERLTNNQERSGGAKGVNVLNRAGLPVLGIPPFVFLVTHCDKKDPRPNTVVDRGEADYKLARLYLDKPYSDQYYGVEALKRAAHKGHSQARYELGSFYYKEKNMKDAAKFFELAAEQGHLEARYNLGICYENGFGVTQNLDEAIKFYKAAADQNQLAAHCALGWIYKEKAGADMVGAYAKAAAQHYIQAADLGDQEGQFQAAQCFNQGFGVEADREKYIKYLFQSASQVFAAQHASAIVLFNGDDANLKITRNPTEAEQFFLLAAQREDIQALCILGEFYRLGLLGADPLEQHIQALSYYRRAASLGHRYSAYAAGMLLLEQGNIGDALSYLIVAAKNGEMSAQAVLGRCIVEGIWLERDVEFGLQMIQEAADQGCSEAYEILAFLYSTRQTTMPQFAAKAQHYTQLVAEQKRNGTFKKVDANAPDFWKIYEW